MGEFENEWESDYDWGNSDSFSQDRPPFQSYSGKELIETKLGGNHTAEFGNHIVSYSRDIKQELIEEIQRVINFESDDEIDANTGLNSFEFKMRIIVSKNDTFLRQQFSEIEPESNEICLFLEDNSGDLLSGRSYYVAVGDDFKEFIAERYTEYNSTESIGFERIYENDDIDMSVNFSREEIQELIETGRIANPYSETFYSTLKILTITIRWAGRLYKYIGGKILDATNFVKENMKFKAIHWDPQADENKDKDFQPVLFPGSGALFDSITPENADLIESRFRSAITGFSQSVISNINTLLEVDFSRVSRRISGLNNIIVLYRSAVTKIIEIATSFVDILMSGISEMIQFFISFGERFLSVLNAYYCGLWNSLVDAVIGIPEIVGFIFKGLGAIGHALDNAEVVLPRALETIDEVLQSVRTINIVEILSKLASSLGGALSGVGSSIGLITLEKFYHFMGAVAGFIVENAIGFLLSAGIANIASLLTKLGKFGKLAQVVIDVIQKANSAIETVGASIIDTILSAIRWFFSLLRRGGDGIATMIRGLMTAVRRGTELAIEAVLAFLRKIGLDARDWDNLQRMGYDMIDIDDAGQAMLRMNC